MVRTLKDLDVNSPSLGVGHPAASGGEHSSAYHKPISTNNNNNNHWTSNKPPVPMTFDTMKVCHIPGLPMADAALTMIQRVCKEFEPIIKRRGYNVKSVSEMCCCNDGLDFDHTNANSGGRKTNKSNGRKRKIMANNVWGYNQTTFLRGRGGGRKSHTIHLRLRHPTSHDRLLLYEDVAGTMAHELAHCEVGPHNDKFNKLMDDILEEHMMLQCKQQNNSGPGSFVPFGGEGVALGGSKGNNGNTTTSSTQGGFKLGGDNKFTQWLSPGEAACMAAEARRRQQNLRLRGNHCCQPVTITITDDNDDIEPIVEVLDTKDGKTKTGNKKRPTADSTSSTNGAKKPAVASKPAAISKPAASAARKKPQKEYASLGNKAIIDLTEEDLKTGDEDSTLKLASAVLRTELDDWACQRCTFINQAMALACSMCSLEKRVA